MQGPASCGVSPGALVHIQEQVIANNLGMADGGHVVVRLEPHRSRTFAPASAQYILRALGPDAASLRLIGNDVEYTGESRVPAGQYEVVRAAPTAAPTAADAAWQQQFKEEMQGVLQDGLMPVTKLVKLLFMMNLKPASYSSKSEEYRKPALEAYKVSKGSTVLCQVSDRYFPAKKVKAAHIVRLEWSAVAAHMGVAINSPKNVIFMHHKLQEAYDRQEWCLLVQPDGNMQVEVLHKSLLQREANRDTILDRCGELGTPRDPGAKRGSDDKLSWADLQGQLLIIPEGAATQPAKRCVTLHALSARESAIGRGWIGLDEVVVPETGWSSPGFDEELMGRLLRDITQLVEQGVNNEIGSDAALGVTPEDSYS